MVCRAVSDVRDECAIHVVLSLLSGSNSLLCPRVMPSSRVWARSIASASNIRHPRHLIFLLILPVKICWQFFAVAFFHHPDTA